MKTVRIQNLGNVSFPDEMSEEDIVSAIEHDILPTTQLEAGLRPKHESVVWPSIKRTGGRMLSGLGTVLEDVTGENAASRALTDTGKEIISANPPPIQSFSELVASPWTAVKQFAAEQIPQVGAAALGARAGATLLAPFGPAAASAGAIAGGLGAIGIQEYAEIRDKQKQQGRENIPVAVLAAAAAAGLERLGVEKLAGDLLTKPAIAGIRSALKQGGKRGVEALLVEAPPEFLQTVVERAGGFESLTSPEAIEEYKLSTAAGAIGGPAIGGPLGVLEGATSAPPSRPPSRPPRPEPTDAQHRAVLQALEELRRAEDGDGGQVDPAAIRAGNEALRTAEAELTTPSQPAEEAPPETVEPAPPPAIRDLNDAATDLAEALKVDRPPPSTEGAEATQVPTTEAVAATASEFSPVTEGRPSIDLPPTLEQPPSAIEIEIPASGAMAQLQGFLGVRPAVPESTTPATPESIATRYPSVDKYSNYLRGRYGVNQWNEWRRDGSIARWWAEAHGEAPGAAQAEPATVGVPAEERPAATVEAKPKARKSRLSPSTEPRLRDPAVSGAMADLVKDAGWATRGGLLIRERDEEGNAGGMSSGAVTGRTKWEPKAEWYLDIAQKLSADGKAEQEAVRKAIAGEPLTAKEKRFVTEMADVAESYLRGGEDTANTAERAPTAVTAVPETDVEADKEAELERLAIQAENDLPAVPDDELASEQSSAMDDWLREIEADEQQNADARGDAQGEGQARAQDAGEAAARAPAAAGDEGNAAPGSDRLLEGYDQAELDRRAAARAAAEKKAADEAAEAERKAQADRDRSAFRLAGSSSEADRAASYGQQELQPAGGASTEGEPGPASAGRASMIEDAGEKIGGARKDKWAARGLMVSDMADMTEAEAATVVRKQAVWKPDYAQMIADGADPMAAALVKTVYDKLAAAPTKNTPAGRRQYVTMMQAVREVLGSVKTVDDMRKAQDALAKKVGMSWERSAQKSAAAEEARDTYWSVVRGRKSPFGVHYQERRSAEKLIAAGFPNAAPWRSRLEIRERHGHGYSEQDIARYRERSEQAGTPMTAEQLRGQFFTVHQKGKGEPLAYAATEAEAETAAESVYANMKRKGGEGKLPERPHLDRVQRRNLPVRRQRDAASEDFINDFGFRGIEFGNWAASDERQKLVNLAYDALHDLAEVLGIPPAALSLNGTMGLALGARGSGRSTAHYEPGKLVINMTKINGAGSLAHEWGHALDHYFGELDRPDSYETGARGATGWYAKPVRKTHDNLRPEMRDAWQGVMSALFERDRTKAERIRDMELNLEQRQGVVATRRERLERARDAAKPDLKYVSQLESWLKDEESSVLKGQEILAKERGDPERPGGYGKVKSSFYTNAIALSGKSGERGYWARPTEMFARAFESFVFDRIAERGAESQYLVQGVEATRFASGYKGNPYPSEDRPAINAAMQTLVDTLRVREGERGPALFAKDQAPDPTPWRMDREDTIKGPMFVGDDVFLDPDGPMLGGRFRWTVRDTASAKAIGSLVMAMDGDRFTALHSINAKREQKVDANGEPVVDANGRPVYERAPEAAYFGRRVLRALTASNGAPFAIRDIVRNPATRQFYEEAGAHDYTEDGRHAVIDWRSYAATDREIASRVDPRGDGGALSEGRRGIPGVSRGESARSQAAGGTSSQSAEGTPRQGLTVSQAQAEIRRLFGKKIAEADWLHIVESPAEIPAGLRASGQVAVTDPNEGPTKGHVWIVASRTTADSAFYTGIEGIALHEGLHAGLEGMLGRKHYNLARAWVRSKLRNGSPDDRAARAVAAARALVPNDTAAQHVDEETLAYLVQDARNHDLPMVKRILAWLRAWAFRLGWTKNLTPETLAELARMAIHARTRGVVSSPGRFAKSARAPDDLFGAGRPGYRPITDAERKRLVIPPAWTDVYIAEDPNAKLVAYGTDKKGRTQPRYSREHTAAALQKKFFRARQFNAALPQMLQRIEQDADAGIEEAVVLEVIAHTGFRIGNQKMLGDQEAFGATTLKPEHVLIDGDLVAFNFPGKRGKLQDHRIDNARLARHLSERQQRGNGRIFTTSDAKVRAYLHSIAAQKFKVHDFRTWNATKAARQAMAERPVPRTPDEFWDSYGAVGDAAADKIGDTRKVALESYVDPLIFSEWREHAGVEENATRPPKRKRKAAPEADRRAADDGREHAGNERLLRGREVRESSQQALSARGPDVERGAWSPEAAFESSAVTAARARLEPWIDELRYQAQDRFHYLNKAQRAAADARGLRELPEAQDAYLAELRYHGMAAAAIEDFQRDHVDPMLKAMQVAGLTTEQVDDFLHARHAPEANAQLQRINPNRENNEALSGMSNDEAAAVIEKARKAGTLGALEDIGRRVDEITQARRDLLVASGLETPATIERWEATYGHYVPLKREGFEDAMPRRGRGFDLRGKEKRRVGSTRDVEHILANVVAQHEATIVRAEKAKVGRALLEFARENPDPALFEVDQLQYRPAFDADGLVTYRPDPGFILADNVLVVRENGHDHRITFNEANPDAMKIAAAMKNLGGGDAGAILNVLTKFSRFLSLVNTGANPEFIISNFARDAQTAGYNLSGTEADNLKWQILRDAGKAWAGIRKFQKGQTSPWAAHFDAFRKAGAQTGWMEHYKDISDREKALIAKVHNMGSGNWQQIKRGLKAIEQFIEQENTAVENAIRLSTFVHARQAGMTEAKAARLAKEITVNFNRRGNMGQTLNAMYLFYNASIQGSVRILQALASSSKVRKLAVATIVGAALLDMWNRSMGDDDDDKPNPYDSDRMQHVKERNLVLMLPSGRTIMIPLPWGYNVLHVMGQAIGETLTRPDATLTGSAGRVAASVVDAFNPIGGSESILQMVSPTITDPMVQWFTNEDWKGDPLRPADNPFGVDKPDSQKYWNSVRAPSKWVTERLNALTGGDEVRPGVIDISPELIDLLIDTFTGGAGRFVTDTLGTPWKAVKGEDVETYEVPLLRKVYRVPGMGDVMQDYYKNRDAVALTAAQVKHYQGDQAKIQEIRAEHMAELRLVSKMKLAEARLAGLRKMRKATTEQSRLKEIDEKIKTTMEQFNAMYYQSITG